MKVKSESEVAQLCLTLSDPMDCSLPGSSIHGIFQARVLELGAIAFSDRFAVNPTWMKRAGGGFCFSENQKNFLTWQSLMIVINIITVKTWKGIQLVSTPSH